VVGNTSLMMFVLKDQSAFHSMFCDSSVLSEKLIISKFYCCGCYFLGSSSEALEWKKLSFLHGIFKYKIPDFIPVHITRHYGQVVDTPVLYLGGPRSDLGPETSYLD
jgi:hypothetical protein